MKMQKEGLMKKIKLNTPTKASTVMIYDLIKTNATLANIVKAQQSELDMQGFRIQGFLDYIKTHCKEKKVRKDLH